MVPERPPAPLSERLWLATSALLPALFCAPSLDLWADGGRDLAVVRTAGLGYTGGLRALDAWAAAVFAGLPLGTRLLRAELPGVFLVAATGALLFVVLRRSLAPLAGASTWSAVVAALASATVTLSFPFQHEAASAGSSLLGVVLALAALVLATGPSPAWPLLSALVTLGLSYEPALGVVIAAAVVAPLALRPRATGEPAPLPASPGAWIGVALGSLAGGVPFAVAALRARLTPLSTSARLLASPDEPLLAASERGARHALVRVEGELGDVLLLLALIGLVWGVVAPRGRRSTLVTASVTATAWGALALGRGGVLDAWSAAGLVALAGTVVLAAVAMQEGVLRVARARLPLASGSAAMVVVLLAAFPATLLDDGMTRPSARHGRAVATWEDAMFGGLPSGTLVLVSAPRLYARLLATRASGDLPGDFSVIPTFDPANETAAAALAHDERLVPLFRDLALTGVPQELSLSTLAAMRPLAVATDPRWDRSLTRHLVPAGLLAVFEPEPRGGADRKRALDASAPWRDRLAKELGTPPQPALAWLTSAILLDRALAAIETGEREVAARAVEETATFAPNDPRLRQLSLRAMAARGQVDVHDLLHEGLAGAAP